MEDAEHFFKEAVLEYKSRRDFPAENKVSGMSPRLHFGEISPWRLWSMALQAMAEHPRAKEEILHYQKELLWREFGYELLYHEPHTDRRPLRKAFADFPWHENEIFFASWKKGQTGYPIVDAAMRQLWQTGWMHNRLRMIVASFLVKDLLIPWQKGAAWFWDTLFDADLPNNTLGWQWAAGSGADAAPYFRIFHPVLQGVKFDPRGDFVRKFVPELKDLPNAWIHRPFEAPEEVLAQAKVRLGVDYPLPIVDHKKAREQALKAYDSIKSSPAHSRH